jgi:dTDP-4-dehydrorhamnose reductase
MNVLVTGGQGMLARAVAAELARGGHAVRALDRAALDVTDPDAVAACVTSLRPDAVVQCAAYTAVDRAEEEEAEAHRVNAVAAGLVAEACNRVGSVFVYPSTDYVFPGDGTRPYRPTDPTGPVNAYGRSKRAGEEAARAAGRALVVRTSWLYGPGGPNFVDSILRSAAARPSLDVVDDQIGRPTSTATLAMVIARLLGLGAVGTFHASDGGEPVTWYGFAREIIRLRGLNVALRPVPSTAFPRPAPRPAYSVLDCTGTEAVIGRALPDWPGPLASHLADRGSPGGGAGEA